MTVNQSSKALSQVTSMTMNRAVVKSFPWVASEDILKRFFDEKMPSWLSQGPGLQNAEFLHLSVSSRMWFALQRNTLCYEMLWKSKSLEMSVLSVHTELLQHRKQVAQDFVCVRFVVYFSYALEDPNSQSFVVLCPPAQASSPLISWE